MCNACSNAQLLRKARQHQETAEWAAQQAAQQAAPAQAVPQGEAVVEAKAKAAEAGTTAAGNEAADDAEATAAANQTPTLEHGLQQLPRHLSGGSEWTRSDWQPAWQEQKWQQSSQWTSIDEDESEDNSWGEWGPEKE